MHELFKDLQSKSMTVTRREEVLLWNVWSLLLVIGLLTAEWILRKWWSLS